MLARRRHAYARMLEAQSSVVCHRLLVPKHRSTEQEMQSVDNLQAWMLLAAIARRGTLKGASIECDMTLPQASKVIRNLEAELRISLLDRNSRPARLTPFAARHLPIVEEMVACRQHLLRAAEEAVASAEPAVSIRFGFSVSCIGEHVVRCLGEYKQLHPNVDIEIFTSKTAADVLDGSIDLVYLMHPTTSPSLLFYECGVCPNLLLASPAYLAEHGTPRTVEELAHHTLILERRENFEDPEKLYFKSEMFDLKTGIHYRKDEASGSLLEVSRSAGCPAIRYENDYTSRIATVMGKGIAVDLPLSFVGDYIENREIVAVLPGWHKRRWRKTVALKPETMKHPQIAAFVLWYQKWETQNAHQRWKHFYDYFGVPETVIGTLD